MNHETWAHVLRSRCSACHRKTSSGFSLVETVIVVSVTVIVFALVSSAIVFFYRSNAYTVEQSSAVNAARKGIEFMARDIREAVYGADGSYPVSSMSPYQFVFYSDTRSDAPAERVRYTLNGTTLEKGIVSPAGDPAGYVLAGETVEYVADSVRNNLVGTPVFTYYDQSGVEILDFSRVTDVARVRVNVIVNVNPDRAPNEFTLYSSATLRNLKTNL